MSPFFSATPDHSRRSPKHRAFTLIELLAVIAIIGILAAILFSVFGSITKAKNNTVCLSNLRQIGTATLLYCNDHSGAFPPALSFPPAVTNAYSPWNRTIAPYLGLSNDTAPSPIFKCPADPRDYEASPGHYARSYTFSATNSFSAGNSNDWMGLIQVSSPYATRKMNQITVPGKTIMVTEWWTSTTGAIRDNWQDSYNYSTTNGWQSLANFPINADGRPNTYYHNASYNIAFVDGHVGALTPAEICAGYDPGRNTYWRAVR
ncbi:MAG TPA: prepilin-type N-terminal cleavage/methylation domain-containing protein [Rariglobus sp.]|nr:prepilin-type N-terminal cleavage/methylation domain-containing protein [Rariglobus sp.]